MRSGRFVFVVTSGALLALVSLIAGCSDDKPVVPVNPADAQYDLVTTEVAQYLDTVIAQFANGLTMAAQDGDVTNVITQSYSPVNPDSLLTGDGWNVVYVADIVAGYNSFRIDSIQFRHQGMPQDVVTGADAMALIQNWSFENPDTTVDYRNLDVHSVFVFSNINTDNAVVNGVRNQTIETKTNGVKRDYEIQFSYSGVTIPNANNNWENGCPQSGLIQGTVNLTQQSGSNIPTTTSWDFEITIDNGDASVNVTAGPYNRSFTSPLCTL